MMAAVGRTAPQVRHPKSRERKIPKLPPAFIHFGAASRSGIIGILPTPTALWPPAQGCEARATLGKHADIHQPQRGCVYREPNDATRSGLKMFLQRDPG